MSARVESDIAPKQTGASIEALHDGCTISETLGHAQSAGHKPTSLYSWLAASTYLAGVILRAFWVFKWNRCTEHLISDMAGYHGNAQNFLNPNYVPNICDTVWPPGSQVFFGLLMGLDASLHLTMVVQFLMCCLTPLLLFGIAWDLFGKRTARVVLIMSSLYFPLFEYAGFYMTENAFMCFMVLSYWLMIRSLRTKKAASTALALLAGLVLGVSASFKSVSLPSALGVFVVLILASALRKYQPSKRLLIAASIGLLVVLAPMAVRGTKLSEGRFCLIANDTARNILMGHYGEITSSGHHLVVGPMTFHDQDRGIVHVFGSPAAAQKGYNHAVTVPYGAYEQRELMHEAYEWIGKHPWWALQQSFEHMFDLFYGTLPWPSGVTKYRPWTLLFSQIFLVFILFPAAIWVLRCMRGFWRLEPRLMGDLMILMPILGIMFAAFIALGEPRYRVPFDGFFILLAARCYCRGSRPDEPTLLQKGVNCA